MLEMWSQSKCRCLTPLWGRHRRKDDGGWLKVGDLRPDCHTLRERLVAVGIGSPVRSCRAVRWRAALDRYPVLKVFCFPAAKYGGLTEFPAEL